MFGPGVGSQTWASGRQPFAALPTKAGSSNSTVPPEAAKTTKSWDTGHEARVLFVVDLFSERPSLDLDVHEGLERREPSPAASARGGHVTEAGGAELVAEALGAANDEVGSERTAQGYQAARGAVGVQVGGLTLRA